MLAVPQGFNSLYWHEGRIADDEVFDDFTSLDDDADVVARPLETIAARLEVARQARERLITLPKVAIAFSSKRLSAKQKLDMNQPL